MALALGDCFIYSQRSSRYQDPFTAPYLKTIGVTSCQLICHPVNGIKIGFGLMDNITHYLLEDYSWNKPIWSLSFNITCCVAMNDSPVARMCINGQPCLPRGAKYPLFPHMGLHTYLLWSIDTVRSICYNPLGIDLIKCITTWLGVIQLVLAFLIWGQYNCHCVFFYYYY